MTRSNTYAKHAGRATSPAEVQLDIFASGAPKEMAPKKRKTRTMLEAHRAAMSGMERSAASAEKAVPGWSELAIEAVRLAVVTAKPGATFTMEQLRARVEDGIPEPVELRAWGSVTRALKARDILAPTGKYAPAVTSNGSPKPIYKAGTRATSP